MIEDLQRALEESVKLQSHYAGLLNAWDGGERTQFANAKEWIERLTELGEIGKEPTPPIPTGADPDTLDDAHRMLCFLYYTRNNEAKSDHETIEAFRNVSGWNFERAAAAFKACVLEGWAGMVEEPNQEPTEGELLLMQLADAELKESGLTSATVKMPVELILALIGVAQVGLRLPATDQVPHARMVRAFLLSLIESLAPDRGPLRELLMKGFDPNFEIFREPPP